jgi:hypothetical protein
MERRAYPSDLSDAEYARLAPHLPAPAPSGRPWRWPSQAQPVARVIVQGLRGDSAEGAHGLPAPPALDWSHLTATRKELS